MKGSESDRLPPIGISDVMKLVSMLAVAFAIVNWGVPFPFGMLVASVSVGLFVAQHFANTPRKEFLFLLVLPDALFMTAMMVYLFPSISLPSFASFAETLAWITHVGFILLAAAGVSLVPVTVVLLTVIVMVSLIHRLTGIQLVRYDWSRETVEESGTDRVGSS